MKTTTLKTALPNKWLIGPLLITVALTLWAFIQEDASETEVVELADHRSVKLGSTNLVTSTAKPSQQQSTVNVKDGAIAWNRLKRTSLQDNIDNPFKVHSWVVVPPAKKVKPAPLPPPVAPPAPFTYMGKYEETSTTAQIFLLANGKLYAATQGKNIDSQWRLDGEDASNLHLTFLPLNLPQVLSKVARPIVPAAEPINTEMNL